MGVSRAPLRFSVVPVQHAPFLHSSPSKNPGVVCNSDFPSVPSLSGQYKAVETPSSPSAAIDVLPHLWCAHIVCCCHPPACHSVPSVRTRGVLATADCLHHPVTLSAFQAADSRSIVARSELPLSAYCILQGTDIPEHSHRLSTRPPLDRQPVRSRFLQRATTLRLNVSTWTVSAETTIFDCCSAQ
jgi:hypothetical protein